MRLLEVPSLTVHFRAVGEGELTERVIEDLRLGAITILTAFATTHAVGFDRIGIFGPATNIQVVNVLLANLVAGEPDEVIPVVALEFHLRLISGPAAIPDATAIPVDAR